MPDYLDITTAIRGQDGTLLAKGTLYATISCALTLAGGDRIPAGTRQSYPIVNGVAANFKLPITEDANPAHATVWLSYQDALGRSTNLGPIEVPRAPGPVALSTILPIGGY